LAVSFFMTIIDLTIVNVSLPAIGRDLHFSETNLQWVPKSRQARRAQPPGSRSISITDGIAITTRDGRRASRHRSPPGGSLGLRLVLELQEQRLDCARPVVPTVDRCVCPGELVA
jgi:hypothetical protein